MQPHLLVLGGARSGKSRYAESQAVKSRLDMVYLATAEAFDGEMAERIAHHQQSRAGRGWTTIETPRDLAATLKREARPGRVVLIDCLTLWLNNLVHAGLDVENACAQLCVALPGCPSPIILVSNEIGLGLVPETALGRAFRDQQGRLNQSLAAIVPHVVFLCAGLPLTLKPSA
jgi:adenosylcobinamide kinase / adenosylcobinamide-phosphate guanylyltransferase